MEYSFFLFALTALLWFMTRVRDELAKIKGKEKWVVVAWGLSTGFVAVIINRVAVGYFYSRITPFRDWLENTHHLQREIVFIIVFYLL